MLQKFYGEEIYILILLNLDESHTTVLESASEFYNFHLHDCMCPLCWLQATLDICAPRIILLSQSRLYVKPDK